MMKAAVTNTRFPGVEVHGNLIRVFFMFKRTCYTHMLRRKPNCNRFNQAVQLRNTLFAQRNGSCNPSEFFPFPLSAVSSATSKRSTYLTRHTYACRSLTARVNSVFIAYQMGHKDYFMLEATYCRWIDKSSGELERITVGMEAMAQITPKSHQEPTA